MAYYPKIINIINVTFKHIFPKAITDNILIGYIFDVTKIKQFTNIPWSGFNRNSSIVCINGTIYVFMCYDYEKGATIFELDINTLNICVKEIDIKQKTKCMYNHDEKISLFSSDMIGFMDSKYSAEYIGNLDTYVHCDCSVISHSNNILIVDFFLDNKDIIRKFSFNDNSLCYDFRYRFDRNDRNNISFYHEFVISAFIFRDVMVIITNKKHTNVQLMYMYHAKTFKLTHLIHINYDRKILAACANSSCMFVLRKILQEKIVIDNTRLCIDVFSINTFGLNHNRIPINKPDKTINIGKTLKYNTTKYIVSANDSYLIVSNDDYQLNVFEVSCWL